MAYLIKRHAYQVKMGEEQGTGTGFQYSFACSPQTVRTLMHQFVVLADVGNTTPNAVLERYLEIYCASAKHKKINVSRSYGASARNPAACSACASPPPRSTVAAAAAATK